MRSGAVLGYNGVMTLIRTNTPNAAAADEAAFEYALRVFSEGARPVVIVPSYDETVRLKKAWAERMSFGIDVATLSSWAADLWELYGDGRTFVDSVQRELIAGAALRDHCEQSPGCLMQPTSGTRSFIARVAREALPKAAGEHDLGRGEREAVEVLDRYRDIAASAGLVEQSEALALLADASVLAQYRPATVGFEPDAFTAVEQDFLACAGAVAFVNERSAEPVGRRAPELASLLAALFEPDEEHPVAATGAVRFVLPSGRYAAPRSLCDALAAIRSDDPDASVAVAARDAFACFEDLAPRLAARGIAAEVRGSAPFAATEFGSSWLALLETLFGETPLLSRAATDFAIGAYSGVGVRSAYWMDARWRANRSVDRDSILTDLAGNADHGLNGLVGSLESGRVEEAFDILQAHILKQAGWPEGYRDRQMSALALARTVFEAAAALGACMEDYRSVLEGQRLFVRTASDPAAERSGEANSALADEHGEAGCGTSPVLIVDLEGAAALGAASCDCLLVTDLTAAAYPVRDDGGAVSSLLEKLDAAVECDGLSSVRATFADALSVPRSLLVLSRPLNNPAGDEERPAVVFEDVIDCYRSELQNPGETDKKTGLTAALLPYASTLGEQGAYENLSFQGEPQRMTAEIPVMPTGFVTSDARDKILLPQQWGGVVNEGYSLSPSAIESYLECPYKWFAHRRLRLEELDAGFGGREFGLFAHRVLEHFYAQFRCEVAPKVTADTLPRARRILERVFDDQLAYDATLVGDATALVALDDLERREVDDLKRKLVAYLDREARLLPGFAPLDGEVSFGRKQGAFEYAGFKVNGTIDRVDVDGYGRAVVVDYKGAVGRSYALKEKADAPPTLPRKVQTLIYAQAVRKTMGLEPVGALYLSYGKDEGIAGSFDHALLDPEKDLLGIDAATCGTLDFAELLDRVEEAVAIRLESLLAGDIPACPRDEDACTYCPVTVCSVRDALQRRSEGDE